LKRLRWWRKPPPDEKERCSVYGYTGKILQVDLTKETTKTIPSRIDEVKQYIGGIGLAIKLVYDNLQSNIDPLEPENVLVVATGPTSGVMAPTGWGHVFAAKSPLTGAIGASVEEGFLSGDVKRAGYDAIVLKGRCKNATYLWVNDDSVGFEDARNLWGLSPARSEDRIRKDLADTSIRVAAIGLAGERLARIASIVTEGSSGRTGLGAVMGSKNLKAIAVRGGKELEVADPGGLLKFCREYFLRAKGSAAVKHFEGSAGSETIAVRDRVWGRIEESPAKYRDLGTSEDIEANNALGCLPTRNFNAGTFEGSERIGGENLNKYYIEKTSAYSPSPISCEHIAVIKEGPYKDVDVRIEYQPLWAFGPNCGIDRLDAVIKAIDMCNFYGLDPISTGNAVSFAMDCYERGILSYDDIGMRLQFGNYEAMLEMVRRIGAREGLGDVLGEGVKLAAQRIDKGAEDLANHVKGLEMTGYDVRCLKTAALGYAVSFIGADHERHRAYLFDIKKRTDRFVAEKGRGKLVKDMEDFYAVTDSLLVSKFLTGIYEGFDDLATIYNLITGLNITGQEMGMAGERINNLARMFNVREGLTRKDDHLPKKVMSVPIPEGASKGSFVTQEDLDLLLDDYYEARGWTKEGIPTQGKLEELAIRNTV
jgi:aldehyde:ferredoxin oxidoreductase